MLSHATTGYRVRERRVALGLRQLELANLVGISTSYLNLIEHGKRRIGGKLLLNLAEVLKTESSLLADGAQAELVARLNEASAKSETKPTETEVANSFAMRFPYWAKLLVSNDRRIRELEQVIEALSDRLNFDPQLAASLHEVINATASIRSTSSILVDTENIEPQWQRRFFRNISEDSERLTSSAEALNSYFDQKESDETQFSSTVEEVDKFFEDRNYDFLVLENPSVEIDKYLADLNFKLKGTKNLLRKRLGIYLQDAAALPIDLLLQTLEDYEIDPFMLSEKLNISIDLIMRRLATLPSKLIGEAIGYVSCDAAGAFLQRRSLSGFRIPKFGAACPRWPIYLALQRPMMPIYQNLSYKAQDNTFYKVWAYSAVPKTYYGSKSIPIVSQMLILPNEPGIKPADVNEVGAACRVCSIDNCDWRREPSITNKGF